MKTRHWFGLGGVWLALLLLLAPAISRAETPTIDMPGLVLQGIPFSVTLSVEPESGEPEQPLWLEHEGQRHALTFIDG